MNRARGVNPIDIIVFGSIIAPFALLTLAAGFVPYGFVPWKIASVILLDLVSFTLVFVYFFEKWLAKPDFVTKHGTAFWINGIQKITPELMDKALDNFVARLSVMTSEVSRDELMCMLSRTGIEWKTRTVELIWKSHHLKGKAGVQIGYRLLIQWKGSVAKSAFYHELLHEVNENIRLPRLPTEKAREEFREHDIKHGELDWWRLGDTMNDDF